MSASDATQEPQAQEDGSKPEPIAIRTSDRGTFKRCRQLWDFKSPIRMHLTPTAGAKPLEFGIAIHAGLEVYYKPELFKLDDSETRELLALAAFKSSCQEYIDQRKTAGIWDEEAEQDFNERMELGIGMLQHYFQWAPKQDKHWTPVYSEIEFEVPVVVPEGVKAGPDFSIDTATDELYYKGQPVVYQGRLDLIIQDERGKYWIVDHKTAAQFADTGHLDLDQQCGSYAWAVQQMLGIQIEGIIYSELKKSVPSPPKELVRGGYSKAKNQSTTYELYYRTLVESGEPLIEYEEMLEHLRRQENPYFRRIEVYRTQTELRILGDLIALEAIDMLSDPFIYPNPNRMNCWGCQFKMPCLARLDGSDDQFLLNDPKLFQPRDALN